MARTKDFDETEVLNRAMNIFWSRGYNATSMEDLVSGLGISRSSLYDTYTDKHTLFIKALESYQRAGYTKIRDTAKLGGPTKDIVKKLIELTTAELITGNQKNGCFMVNAGVEVAPHDKEVSKLVCNNDKQMEEIFFQVIQKGKDKGEIKNPRDARALSKFMFNTVKGLQVTAKSTNDKAWFDDIIAQAVATLDQKN